MNSDRSPLRRPGPLPTSLALGVALVLGSGCYGKFPLTKAVYEFNGDAFDSKILQTLLFWVFILLPVYELSFLADAIIFNLIEFWTDETLDLNVDVPLEGGGRLRIVPDGEHAVLVEVLRDGEISRQRHVRQEDGTVLVYGGDGALHARLVREGDGFAVHDASGDRRGTLPLAALRQGLNR